MEEAGIVDQNEEEVEEVEEQHGLAPGEATEEEDSFSEEDSSEASASEQDTSMVLTAEERIWALAIKQAIEQDKELDNLSDFMYAQYALIDKDNVDYSLDRARHLQWFRQEYGVEEQNLDYACRISQDFQRLAPELFMALQHNERDGNQVLVLHMARAYANVLAANERNSRLWMCNSYYICQALNPDFDAIRMGAVALCENTGFDFKTNFGIRWYKQLWTDLCNVYPLRFHRIKHFNTGVFLNLLVSMAKSFLPAEIHNTFQTGCQCGTGTLDEIYLQPTVLQANQRYLAAIRQSLQKRYSNEAIFSLEQQEVAVE